MYDRSVEGEKPEAGAPDLSSSISFEESKIAELVGVREYQESDTVELWRHSNGRAVIRAYNECGNNYTEVDLWDLIKWLQSGVVERALTSRSPETPD